MSQVKAITYVRHGELVTWALCPRRFKWIMIERGENMPTMTYRYPLPLGSTEHPDTAPEIKTGHVLQLRNDYLGVFQKDTPFGDIIKVYNNSGMFEAYKVLRETWRDDLTYIRRRLKRKHKPTIATPRKESTWDIVAAYQIEPQYPSLDAVQRGKLIWERQRPHLVCLDGDGPYVIDDAAQKVIAVILHGRPIYNG